MKKILVTGGAGFIGSEFIRKSVNKGWDIAVIDDLAYAGDRERLREIGDKFTFFKKNICDKKAVARIFKNEKPDIVVHFAAESHVDRSIQSSEPFIKANVEGTQVMLDSARAAGVEKFVHISTDEVYGDIEKGQFFEHTAFNPSSPYSASKAAADLLVRSYVRTFKFPAVILRPSNNYGPWQYPEKFIPVIIYKALNNEKIPVYGKGLNVREWMHVSDCVNAVFKVISKGKTGEAYNIGSGNEKKNIEVAERILDILDKPRTLIEFVADRPGHDIRYSLNAEKVQRETGWKPVISFDRGIEQTVSWYKEHAYWLNKKIVFLRAYWKKVYKKPNRN